MSRPEVNFYNGLSTKTYPQKIQLFEKSLKSSNIYIKQSSAEELAILMSQGYKLSAKTLRTVNQEISGFWAAAFDVVAAQDKEKALSFLLGYELSSPSFNEARLYVLRECEKQEISFSESELAVIAGHYSASRAQYNVARDLFRLLREDGKWSAQIPEIFLKYPVLINDLGKAYQYTNTGKSALDLFLQWESNLTIRIDGTPEQLKKINDVRYRLLFYAARIARRMAQNTQASALFEKALALAPDSEQSDACIWYIYDATITNIPVFMERLRQFVPSWHNDSSYSDVLVRFLHLLVSNRRWEEIIKTFNLIKQTDAAAAKAGFAWVIARTIEEKYLSNAHLRLVQEASAGEDPYLFFMRFAYDSSRLVSVPSLYYRLMSAAALKLPFLEFSEDKASSGNGESSPALQFVIGFFNNGAGEYAMPYIRSIEKELSANELRIVAQFLEELGDYASSTRLVSLYINNDGYKKNRRDLEILYPRPFKEQVEKYAQAAPMPPALFYGLIRTESAFRSAVVSHAGAIGLSQLMPATAREMIELLRRNGGHDYTVNGEPDLTDPDLNLHIGSFHFNYLMERLNGDTMLSLLSYNSGMTRVRRWWTANSLPADLFLETVPIYETRDYGKRVTASAAIYEILYYN